MDTDQAPHSPTFVGKEDDDDNFVDPSFLGEIHEGQDTFGKEEMKKICSCITEMTLPTWVSRPPIDLGKKSAGHGKLTAADFLTLFSAVFPLILPEFWYLSDNPVDTAMLTNFYNLVACTNIVASYTTSDSEAQKFSEHYTAYRTTLPQLFPTYHSLPKHHYAEHLAALLSYWGPLASLNEFAGERLNGMLQRIKTNSQAGSVITG